MSHHHATPRLEDRLKDSSLLRNNAYIGGEWIAADNGETVVVTDPATNLAIGSVPNMGANETRRAIECAEESRHAWAALPAMERAIILRRWFDLIIANLSDLATIMTAEQGKPLAESQAEIRYAASFAEWFSEEAKRAYGDLIPAPRARSRIMVLKQPIGVVAAITPWNFPAAMITRKCAPAFAAGCSVVVKPSEFTPYSALALAELAERAGIPKGVFNIVTGDATAIGGEMTSSQIVRKISFTGSTRVGKLLLEQSANTVKKVAMELGGNAPLIVFEDADLDVAVQGVLNAKFRNTGQTCICPNRIYVHENVHDTFIERLSAAVSALKVGDGFGESVQQGPLINEAALTKVERHIADAVSKGAKVVAGGKRHELGQTFYEPTVLVDVDATMLFESEETFGPVAPIQRFSDEKAVIKAANATTSGLAAYIFTRDLDRMWRVAEQIESGIVGVNEGLVSNEVAPFGGVKESGIGREGSKYGIEEFLELKYICITQSAA
ncbi:NAD-dependent succinate-semialdehyde dehydrogenase [Brucella pseudogrignonensis]|uniref:Succinate-semialdehyde dehydrogenase/glutarate-semialdehyde dehydrogenase n=1 Tax=Brucella pseudogrignonensis TaxID=419475 RepID=A0ABU1MDL1_9HYPH|nr:NAD-dependent succinate-semialdehyde dehydrogenase [Brucella pseudogrignonensis]MDR6433861.1 succinate-semialdehyde dehydrogenase/glutarate-semialdehyde dehydrogenase [Brucella pseudogrignonensis]